jgi:Holliday junction DNA helicase RuvB
MSRLLTTKQGLIFIIYIMIESSSKKSSKTKTNLKGKIIENDDNLINSKTYFQQDESSDAIELRPKNLEQYIGQTSIKKQLNIIIESARIREKLPEHMLFYGQPGLGKTTLAYLISNELKSNFKVISAPSLQKISDVISLLVNTEPNTVIFIDEIHRLKAPIEESLYSAMEDFQIDIIVGKGQGATTVRMDLPPFMLVGATTKLGKISKPLKDRFPNVFRLEPYSDSEIIDLIERTCKIIKLKLDDDSILTTCRRSRGIPRVANNLLKRLLDLQMSKKSRVLNVDMVKEFFEEMGVFEEGLTVTDINYLQALNEATHSLKSIADRLQETTDTIEEVTEPYLTHLGYIIKTSEGRNITHKGVNYLERLERSKL